MISNSFDYKFIDKIIYSNSNNRFYKVIRLKEECEKELFYLESIVPSAYYVSNGIVRFYTKYRIDQKKIAHVDITGDIRLANLSETFNYQLGEIGYDLQELF